MNWESHFWGRCVGDPILLGAPDFSESPILLVPMSYGQNSFQVDYIGIL